MTAADLLNDRVLPCYEEQVALLRILTDRGAEYCGNREHHASALLGHICPSLDLI